MVVELIVPEDPTTRDEEKEVLSVETSYPVGAVTVIPASISAPETVKESDEDAVPEQDENAERLPLVVINGITASVVKLWALQPDASPEILFVGTTCQ